MQSSAAAINPSWSYTGGSQGAAVSIAAFKPGVLPPTLASVTPSSGDQGAAVAVTLTGTNFVIGATTIAVSGSGVTVSGTSVSSGTSLTATFTIAAGATSGARTVTVTTTGGTSGGQTFTIVVPVLVGYFRWGLAPDALTNETAPQEIDDTATDWVPFSEVLTDLLPATTYYYQAIADDGIDVWYGEILSFTTLGEQTFEDGGGLAPADVDDADEEGRDEASLQPRSISTIRRDYYDGYKRPRVERFLTIARGLSDRDGQIEHMSFGAVLSDIATDRFDTDREFRGTLADRDEPVPRPTARSKCGSSTTSSGGSSGCRAWRPSAIVNDYAPTADLQFE